jgi:hypothetical protein
MTGQPALNETPKTEVELVCHAETKQRRFFGNVRQIQSDEDMDELADLMVQELSDDEREHAARSSYKYLWTSVTSQESEKKSKSFLDEQHRMAKATAMRFLKSKKGSYAVAMLSLCRNIGIRLPSARKWTSMDYDSASKQINWTLTMLPGKSIQCIVSDWANEWQLDEFMSADTTNKAVPFILFMQLEPKILTQSGFSKNLFSTLKRHLLARNGKAEA